MNKFDVFCIGNAAVDVPLNYVDEDIFSFDSYPINKIVPIVGGSGINVSTILSRLGKKVTLSTLLGKDILGDYLIGHCVENDIDVRGVIRRSTVDTSLNIGLVKRDGERYFIVSNSSSTFHFSADDVNIDLIQGAKILHFASIFIMPQFDNQGLSKIFQEAKKHGVIVCADMMKSRKGKRLDAIRLALSYVDYFFANFEEASFLTEKTNEVDIANELLKCGIRNVVIKKGKLGCFLKNSDNELHSPAFINEGLVDTIGAGDNFVAGFITGILDDLDVVGCASFANAAASISVGAIGATSGVKNKQQVLDLLNSK